MILTSVANSRSFDSDSGPNFLVIGILIFMFFSSFYVRVNLRFTQNQIVPVCICRFQYVEPDLIFNVKKVPDPGKIFGSFGYGSASLVFPLENGKNSINLR